MLKVPFHKSPRLDVDTMVMSMATGQDGRAGGGTWKGTGSVRGKINDKKAKQRFATGTATDVTL